MLSKSLYNRIIDEIHNPSSTWLNVARYTSDPMGIRVLDVTKAGITSDRELDALRGIPGNKDALRWIDKQVNHTPTHTQGQARQGRVRLSSLVVPSYVVHIGHRPLKTAKGKHKYKHDEALLGEEAYARWCGWSVDITRARAWKTNGVEASYSDNKGYINVNGKGLHQLVVLAYLLVRARTEPKYQRILKDYVKKNGPYQVNHLAPKLKGVREFNSIGWLSLERVEPNRPNNHQTYTNIGNKLDKYWKNR